MKTRFTTYIPTKLIFGCGELKKLATEHLYGKKAMIVISSGTSMRKFGYLQRVQGLLHQQGIESLVYDKILPNPIKDHVMEASVICRNENVDFIIGLGGGSTIDSAKSIAVMACNPGDYWDYICGGTGKGKPVERALPIVAIPTTAGTGTEADPWTVITHNNEKIGWGNAHTFPKLSIVDPELMVSVPARLTAYQGFDAFFHAAEGFIARCATPVSRAYSLKSLELLYKHLPDAIEDGSNLEARARVAMASMVAGMVESTSSCTSEHSIEHALSAYYPELPHGAGLIAISRAYFATFRNDCAQDYAAMANAMLGRSDCSASDFLTLLDAMIKNCKVDDIRLSDYGLQEKDFHKIADNARQTMGGLFEVDPRPMSEDELLAILRLSYK